jgi:hypothetical protein
MGAGSVVLAIVASLLAVACAGSANGPAAGRPSTGQGESAPDQSAGPAAPDLNGVRFPRAGWKTDFTKTSVDLREIMSGGPGKDGIPAVDQPRFQSLEAAATWLTATSPVIALEVGGHARAYPIAIVIWHEIVNDRLDSLPIAVTFCPLCNTALVFERVLDGTEYDFGTTGNLRFSDLVMYDRQTESWWQQATGEAIVGTLTGKRLRFLPAQIISFAEFRDRYADGDVLSKETGHQRPYGTNPYVGYDKSDERPFLYEGVVDGRLAPKERVVTVSIGTEHTAFPYLELVKVGAANETVGGTPLVVLWVPGTASALDAGLVDQGRDAGATGVFERTVDGRELTFERPGGPGSPIRDRETGSTWSVTGKAMDGELAGRSLKPLVHGDHFWFAWAAFSPETRIWTSP